MDEPSRAASAAGLAVESFESRVTEGGRFSFGISDSEIVEGTLAPAPPAAEEAPLTARVPCCWPLLVGGEVRFADEGEKKEFRWFGDVRPGLSGPLPGVVGPRYMLLTAFADAHSDCARLWPGAPLRRLDLLRERGIWGAVVGFSVGFWWSSVVGVGAG